MVDERLLKILACTNCKGSLERKGDFLICSDCRKAYPIMERGIPNMLIDDAWTIKKASDHKYVFRK